LDVVNHLVKQGLVAEVPLGELAARFLLLQALSKVGFQEVVNDDPGSTQVSSASDEWGSNQLLCGEELLHGLNVHVGDVDSVARWTRPFFTLD
jgi:hypothetical protein